MDFLADEILLHIFKYLTPYDLIDIVKVYPQFEQLLDEKVLWTWIDSRRKKTSSELAKYFYEKVHEGTRAYMMIGNSHEVIMTKEQILNWESFNNLAIIALENMQLDGEEFILGNFPHNLEELSLNQSHIANYYRFFRFCSRRLKKLRVLTLEYCLSVEDSILSPLGNLESLEILSLYGCMAMKDTVVPLTMGCEYGFKKLKVLDVRCTGFGDDLLRYTAKMTQLGELYFHCYFDYMIEKKFHAQRNKETVLQAMEKLLNFQQVDISSVVYNAVRVKFAKNYFEQFSDLGLINYRKSCFRPEGYDPPKSILYERPYGVCKCQSTRPTSPNPTNGYYLTGEEAIESSPSCSTTPAANSSTSSSSSSRKRSHEDDNDPYLTRGSPKRPKTLCTRLASAAFDEISPITTFDPFFEFSDGTILRAPIQHQAQTRILQMSRIISLRPLERLQSMQRMEEEAGQDLLELHERVPMDNEGPLGLPPRPEQHRITIRINRVPVEAGGGIVRLRQPQAQPVICYERINQYTFERQHFIPLSILSLRGSKSITDDGIKSLQQLQLGLLDVTGTSVSREGLVTLKKAMPTCRIIHETMCKCKPR